MTAAINYRPATQAAKTVDRRAEVTFVEKVAPPPPPPPPVVVKAPPKPQPKPVAASPVVPKHIKKVVVAKPKKVKLKTPTKIKKLKLREADPSLEKGVQVASLGGVDPAAAAEAARAAYAPIAPPSAQPAKALASNQLPSFPEAAKNLGKAGLVILRIVIGEDGAVESIKTIRGDEPFLAAALEAVRGWRYEPAIEGGKPMRTSRVVKIPFRLKT